MTLYMYYYVDAYTVYAQIIFNAVSQSRGL